jgi:dienelactone hydrolase
MRSLSLLLATLLALSACSDDPKPAPVDMTPDQGADLSVTPDMAEDLGEPVDQDMAADLAEDMAPMVSEEAAQRIEARGVYSVGNATFALVDEARASRTLAVEVWYPAVATQGDVGEPVELFLAEGADRELVAPYITDGPEGCVLKNTGSTRDAAALDAAKRPLILFSHCHGCSRWSMFSVAEHLASHGFIVVAPDHTGNTITDALRDQNAPLSKAFQAERAADIRLVLDAMLSDQLDPQVSPLPEAVRGRADAELVGMMGHSYGGATTGLVLTQDARVKAGLAFAVPLASGVLEPATMADITQPVAFLLAMQDNSITEVGNRQIRDNHRRANGPSWLWEVTDTGHWSFSTIAGLIPGFAPGCGEGMTQTTPRVPLTYLDNAVARKLAAAFALSFFSSTLLKDADATLYLSTPRPDAATVKVSAR